MRSSTQNRVLIAVQEKQTQDLLRKELSALDYDCVGGDIVNSFGLLNALRIEEPDLLLMHAEFLNADDAHLLIKRSYFVRLPATVFLYSHEMPGWMRGDPLTARGVQCHDVPDSIRLLVEMALKRSLDPVASLRIWARLLNSCAGLPEEQNLIVTRLRGKLGLLLSSEILSVCSTEEKLVIVTKRGNHEAVDQVETILSQVERNCYFEADSGTWIHLDRMRILRKIISPKTLASGVRAR